MKGFRRTILLSVLVLSAAVPTIRGQELSPQARPALADAQLRDYSQIERGQPHKVVDGVGWVFGIPSKLILWDRRAENHHVSAETEQDLGSVFGSQQFGGDEGPHQ